KCGIRVTVSGVRIPPSPPSLRPKRASASCPSGHWNDDDYDVLADGVVVGCISKANAAPVGSPWMWTLRSAITRIVCPLTAMLRVARPWLISPRGDADRLWADHDDLNALALGFPFRRLQSFMHALRAST